MKINIFNSCKFTLTIFILFNLFAKVYSSSFFVSTTALSSGSGSFANPWQLQTALNHPSALKPGDTIWVRGGTYVGSFVNNIYGTALAPIIVRNYNNERAIIDGKNIGYGIQVNGSYTWFWGLEFMSSDLSPRVTTQSGSYPTDILRWTCIYNNNGTNIKFINLIVHDGSQGYGFWTPSINSEIYGNIIYNNGWDAPDRGHGHAIYTQNNTGVKKIHDNIVFNGYGWGIHAYTQNGFINNFDIRNNICFNAGVSNSHGLTSNIYIANKLAENIVLKNNYTYFNPLGSGNNELATAGSLNMVVDSNYFANAAGSAAEINSATNATIKNNTFIGITNISSTTYPQNSFLSTNPISGVTHFVIPNKYEIGRAHIAIYNWDNLSTVQINISNAGLNAGDQYELINVLDYFNDISTGTYDGSGIITVSMTGHTIETPVASTTTPPTTFPAFGAFVLRKSSNNPSLINENENIFKISAYPNPFSDYCTISINNSNSHEVQIRLTNLLGETVLSENFTTNEFQINKGSLATGIYNCSISYNEGIVLGRTSIVIK